MKAIKEKYSRGRRGAPAKGVGRATGARVQIPLSPLLVKEVKKYSWQDNVDMIEYQSCSKRAKAQKNLENNSEKLLTRWNEFDIIAKLFQTAK